MRNLVWALSFILAVGVCAAHAADAPATREIVIFKGDDPAQDGIELGGWGSGKAVRSKEKVLTGAWSIKITSQGLYSGGRLDFSRPVALFSDGIDPKRYIQFAFFFNETQRVDLGGRAFWFDVEPYTVPRASLLRFVFISDSDVVVSAEQPTNPLDPDDNWMRVAVPLAKFRSAGDISEFRLKRLLIFSDIPGTFYLGEMKLITDNTPIKVRPLDSQTVAVMDQLAFMAEAEGGVSSLRYTWDFDASDGIQPEATGKLAQYVYTRGGEFTVTLTVSDADGLKEPVTVTAVITVTD